MVAAPAPRGIPPAIRSLHLRHSFDSFRLCVLSRCFYERAKQCCRRGLLRHVLGVPLHADVEGMRGIFESFNDAVGSMRRDAESAADVLNCLMMRGIHVQLSRTEDAG